MKKKVTIILLVLCLTTAVGISSSISKKQDASFRQSYNNNSASKEAESVEDLTLQDPTLKEELTELLNYVNTSLYNIKYIPNAVSVADINGDHLPEIIFEISDGWEYMVFYYANGSVQEVKDLTAWSWSSNLLKSQDGDLVLYIYAHTTGTAGNLQYRVFHWDGMQYALKKDFCRLPAELDNSGTPVSYHYYSSDSCIDLDEIMLDEDLANKLYDSITQEKFDLAIADLGKLTELHREEVKQQELKTYKREIAQEQIIEFIKSKLKAY